jgi:hypothetical protein
VHGLQEQELLDDEEQEDDDRTPGDEQVLPQVPYAHVTQGNQVNGKVKTANGKPEELTLPFTVPGLPMQ